MKSDRPGVHRKSTVPDYHHAPPSWQLVMAGFAAGIAIWLAMEALNPGGVISLGNPVYPFGLAAVCAALSLTRLRWLPWTGAAALGIILLLVAFTPFIDRRARSLVQQDPVHPCPAVISLCASVSPDGLMSSKSEERLMGALDLIRQGMAARLVIDHFPPPKPSPEGDIRRQITALRFPVPPIDDLGSVRNTHDESVAMRLLCRTRHWRQVLLVTAPLHTRRARAVFRKMGAPVLVRACAVRDYDLDHLNPWDRLRVFREWLHEEIAWYLYRRRGWV
ncbi:MAG TPA: YdcF family protein [Armatimonadota bacterium]|nr:YdcF family protein [Armatimonadota bacterium]